MSRIPTDLRKQMDIIKERDGVSLQAQVTLALRQWVAEKLPTGH